MHSAHATLEETHVYRWSLHNPRLWGAVAFSWLLGNAILVLINVLLDRERSWWSGGFSGGVTIWVLYYFTTSLTTTPRGFTYVTLGITIKGDWPDVEVITRGRNFFDAWVYGERLLLRERVWWRGSSVFLEWFDPHWQTGPIGDDIRRYAPWLLSAPPVDTTE